MVAATAVLLILGTVSPQPAEAQVESVLYNFTGSGGVQPMAALIQDSKGNLYGTTFSGGSSNDGTVFELSLSTSGGVNTWTETVLHNFTGGDGSYPMAALIQDSKGNLYGTTFSGGSSNEGTVFELSPDSSSPTGYSEKVLYNFTGSDGTRPTAALIRDPSGNFYGTTSMGGSSNDGTVFELSPNASSPTGYSEKALYNFTGSDGANPTAGLLRDSSGNLYGTTQIGGASNDGTVFELNPSTSGAVTTWTETLLHSFAGGDGWTPSASLIMDSSGNLYSTTEMIGECSLQGCGTVFELSPSTSGGVTTWTETVLHTFIRSASNDGGGPGASLLMDSSGNLYSTTLHGGSSDAGTVFGIAPVTLSASRLSFGTQEEGTTSTAQSVTITNIGSKSLSYNAASLSGANAEDFTITSDTCGGNTVAANGTCSVSVTFTPSTDGSETASLNLNENGLPQRVSLSGAGALPTAGFSASSLTFSSQPVGTTSSAQAVTVSNTSAYPLDITAVGITGDFAIDSNTCATIASGQHCSVGVKFSPTAGGTRSGTLSFTDNAGNSPQTVALSGKGSDFTLSTLTVSQTVSPGTTAAYTLQLTPQGGFNQAISLACSGAPPGGTCTVNPSSVTLNGTNASSVQVEVSTSTSALVGPGSGNFVPPLMGSLPLVAWLALFGLLGLILQARFSPRGELIRRAAPWATLALLTVLCTGCGGGGSTTTSGSSTPTGTYTLTVKGTSGSLSQSAQITLKVQ